MGMACAGAPSIAIKCIIVVSFVLAVSASRGTMGRLVPLELSMAEKHEHWMSEHGIVYKDAAEKEHRFKIFSAKVQYIESFNAEGKHKYKLGTNQFTDLMDEEFRAKYLCLKHPSHAIVTNATSSFKNVNPFALPPTVDWRAAGAVTPVRNQVSHDCWAIGAVGAMEGIVKIKTGNLISLSEQELIDCQPQGISVGGYVELAFLYVMKYGIASQADYPYTGVAGTCQRRYRHRAATIRSYKLLPPSDEASLQVAVAVQPVAAIIDASGSAFGTYSGGIFTGQCGLDVNHEVTIVGYGTTRDGTKYWLIKNSWGTNWGEGGYMRLLRDVSMPKGHCGIATQNVYPMI